MRLSPPISVLTILAAAFAWMAVSEARDHDCYVGPAGQFTLTNRLVWLKNSVAGQRSQCDSWLAGSPKHHIRAMHFIFFGGQWDFPRTSIEVTITQAGNVIAIEQPMPEDNIALAKTRSWTGKRALYERALRLVEPLEARSISFYQIKHMSDIAGDDQKTCKRYIYDSGSAGILFATSNPNDWRVFGTGNCKDPPVPSAERRVRAAEDLIETDLRLFDPIVGFKIR
ncbi:hypothetical protein [Novosphingobium sp.]|uniref:hypothetical protein n=1 Tax=Novosphingobium sp. TaxID=1874826 RepID=UPI0025D438F1|nr:hypothetical protein [Novosphingobium sp.]